MTGRWGILPRWRAAVSLLTICCGSYLLAVIVFFSLLGLANG